MFFFSAILKLSVLFKKKFFCLHGKPIHFCDSEFIRVVKLTNIYIKCRIDIVNNKKFV